MRGATLPRGIAEQLEKAEEIQRQMQTADNPQEVNAPESEAPAAPAAEQTSPPAAEPKPKVDDPAWEQRFKTLQGKYQAEVPRLHAQLREQSDQMQAMQAQLEALQKKSEAAAAPEAPLVSDKDEDNFGADLLDFIRRVVRDEFPRLASPVVEALRKEMNPVREQLGTVQKRVEESDNDRFWSALERAVPDLDTVNSDQRWLQWLGEVEPLVGVSRQHMLDAAVARLDADRVVALVEAWKATVPAAPAPAKNALESQVAPSRSAASPAVDAETGRIWSGADYERAYDPRLANTMHADEITALRNAADKAFAEGRVRW